MDAFCQSCAFGAKILVSLVTFPLAAFLLDFVRTRDRSIPLKTALIIYFKARYFYFKGCLLESKFQSVTKNIRTSQESVLTEILRQNSGTQYAKEWSLDLVTTREDFVRVHPLVKYEHYRKYCQRIYEGENNVLTKENPVYFGLTSGTTGEPSKIPITKASLKAYLNIFFPLVSYHLASKIPAMKRFRRKMNLSYNPGKLKEKSPTGVPVGAMSAAVPPSDDNTTPLAGYDIVDEPTARYVHLLFALRDRDLELIDTSFASLVYMVFHDLENQWQMLVEDIRQGTLEMKTDLKIPESVRKILLENLSPDPERAAFLENQFRKGFDGISKRIWPKLELASCITSGAFSHYSKILREKYLQGVIMFHPIYAATEGLFGLNLWPERYPAVFLLFPFRVFYEFIPAENVSDESPKTVFMDQVEKGTDYEIVITNSTGLYRYRMGDLVRVVEFYNECPVVEILHRTGQLLSIKGEKVSEIALYSALTETLISEELSADSIVEFTSCESVFLDDLKIETGKKEQSPFYVIFLELKSRLQNMDSNKQDQLAEKLDRSLCKVHGRYRYQREKDGLDPLRLYIVKTGGFARLRYHMIETTTASPGQLKIPRVLRKPELVEFVFGLTQ